MGARRVEVTVPAADRQLIKAIANALRAGGPDAARIRAKLKPLVALQKARTGAELVAFLRASPLVGAEFSVERDRSTGRPIDFER